MKRFNLFALLLCLFATTCQPAFALTTTLTGGLSQEVNAIASDGTYNYLGGADGNIYKQTIATGAINATPIASVPGKINSMVFNGTAVTVTIDGGAVYTVAAASSGLTDGIAFIGINDVDTSGGTYTKTRGAAGNWYLAKTAAGDNSYIGVDVTSLMRTAISKGLKLTSIKVISNVSTQVLDNNFLTLYTTAYADNVAPAVTAVTLTGAQLSVAAGTVGQPKVETAAVTTPAWQNADLTKWAISIFVNSTSQASTVYRLYGIELVFSHDYR